MGRLINYYRLTRAEQTLLVKAACLLAVMRMSLALIPLRALRDALAWRRRKGSVAHGPAAPTLQQITWAIHSAARFVPGCTCLVQGLTALRLGISAGYPVTMNIGTTKEVNGELKAHAWVEYQGQIILGAAEGINYTPLLIWTKRGWRSAKADQS
jgi:hypothetical protein